MVDSNFPTPRETGIHEAASTHEDSCSCTCPERSPAAPPLPTAGISVEDDNVCELQALPLMTANPLQLHVDPAAKPVACHKPTPVPLHWKQQVKANLDPDVALGVQEKVPDNTPTKWLSRMVITPKSNGDPCRTIDYQPLNKYSQRQSFPVQSPFHLANKIPSNVKKSVVDCWNGCTGSSSQ